MGDKEEKPMLNKKDVDLIIDGIMDRIYKEIGKSMVKKLFWGAIIMVVTVYFGVSHVDWAHLFSPR